MAVPVLAGAAVLNPDVLVDSLVPEVIDGLREDLHPPFGVRAYRLYRVVRSWTGKTTGEGSIVSTVGVEFRPQPKVEVWNGLRFESMTCGVNEAGEIKISELSLTYTQDQLTGRDQPGGLRKNQECFLALGEAHGQGSRTQLFAHTRPPFVDREKTMGWVCWLRAIEGKPWEP